MKTRHWMKICQKMSRHITQKTRDESVSKYWKMFECHRIIAFLGWNFMGADFMEPNILLVVNRFVFHNPVASFIIVSTKAAKQVEIQRIQIWWWQCCFIASNLYVMHLAKLSKPIHTWHSVGINSVELSVNTNKRNAFFFSICKLKMHACFFRYVFISL